MKCLIFVSLVISVFEIYGQDNSKKIDFSPSFSVGLAFFNNQTGVIPATHSPGPSISVGFKANYDITKNWGVIFYPQARFFTYSIRDIYLPDQDFSQTYRHGISQNTILLSSGITYSFLKQYQFSIAIGPEFLWQQTAKITNDAFRVESNSFLRSHTTWRIEVALGTRLSRDNSHQVGIKTIFPAFFSWRRGRAYRATDSIIGTTMLELFFQF